MSVPLYITCSAEQRGIRKGKKGKDLIMVIMYRSSIVQRPNGGQSWALQLQRTATLGQPNLYVFWSRGKSEHLEQTQAGTRGAV